MVEVKPPPKWAWHVDSGKLYGKYGAHELTAVMYMIFVCV